MKKSNVSVNEMVEAVRANSKEPWNVLDISRGTWFRNLSKNGVTMVELQSQSQNIETSVNSADVPTHTIRPVPHWSPNVTNEANTVGRGGVRYRYTDIEKYNEFKKEVKKMLHALRTKKATLMPTNFADALEAYAKEVREREEAQKALFAETQQKLLSLEQKQAAEAETERIYQVNKNFHNHLYTATDLAKMLGVSPNKIGKIANEHNLKQEPIYGKLGKVQLNNGRWVEIFYYNDDAKFIIENNL